MSEYVSGVRTGMRLTPEEQVEIFGDGWAVRSVWPTASRNRVMARPG